MTVDIEEIATLVRVQLGLPRVLADEHFMEDLGAESADLVNIIAVAEDKYRITFNEAEISRVRTVRQLHELVRKMV